MGNGVRAEGHLNLRGHGRLTDRYQSRPQVQRFHLALLRHVFNNALPCRKGDEDWPVPSSAVAPRLTYILVHQPTAQPRGPSHLYGIWAVNKLSLSDLNSVELLGEECHNVATIIVHGGDSHEQSF